MIRAGLRDNEIARGHWRRGEFAIHFRAGNRGLRVRAVDAAAVLELEMSYVRRSLVPGETLMYDTRHHWIVLIGPLILFFLLVALGIASIGEVFAAGSGRGFLVDARASEMHTFEVAGVVLIVIALIALAWGFTKRNATEMAVTNRRVLIKTGLGNRRTLDVMLSRVESIGVEETFLGRMLGYGSVTVRGTGGTPESFVMISRPQEFRRSVQAQIGHVEPVVNVPPPVAPA